MVIHWWHNKSWKNDPSNSISSSSRVEGSEPFMNLTVKMIIMWAGRMIYIDTQQMLIVSLSYSTCEFSWKNWVLELFHWEKLSLNTWCQIGTHVCMYDKCLLRKEERKCENRLVLIVNKSSCCNTPWRGLIV